MVDERFTDFVDCLNPYADLVEQKKASSLSDDIAPDKILQAYLHEE